MRTGIRRLGSILLCASFLVSLSGLSVAQLGSEPSDTSVRRETQSATNLAKTLAQSDDIEKLIESFSAYQANFPSPTQDDWGDPSPDYMAQKAQAATVLYQRLKRIDNSDLPPTDLVNLEIMERMLDSDIRDFAFDTARIPFTGDYGFHMMPVMASFSVRIKTTEDAKSWLERLDAIPAFLEMHTNNIRRGLATGFVAHIDPVQSTIQQIKSQIGNDVENSDFFIPFLTMPDDIAGTDRTDILRLARQKIKNVNRAYEALLDFLETDYLPSARDKTGITILPDGPAYYAAVIAHHTTDPDLTPESIHQLGQSEVIRIRGEMLAILQEVGFRGSLQDFISDLRSNPQFYAQSEAELLGHAALMSKRLDALLPQYFEVLPRLTYGVVPVPASYAANYTTGRYQRGDWEKGKAGRYLVNTYRLDQRPLYELPALSAHEAVPGHHLQIALAQEIGTEFPDFRRKYYATAFGEGWALYAEKLAGEAGFYQTPYERFGQLSYEMWRACRLVVDTGLHLYHWTREQARACFLENTALAPHNIETEITRYIGWPGQAVAYKVGELRILTFRKKAMDALGESFDIRVFHNILLGQGSMPLPSLERQIDRWINKELTEASDDDLAKTLEEID